MLTAFLSMGLLLLPAVIRAQIHPPTGQCGLVPSNPCKPGTALTPALPGLTTVTPESGPYTLIDTVSNYGGVGGTYDVSCTGAAQVQCSVSPRTFHLAVGAQQVVTTTY